MSSSSSSSSPLATLSSLSSSAVLEDDEDDDDDEEDVVGEEDEEDEEEADGGGAGDGDEPDEDEDWRLGVAFVESACGSTMCWQLGQYEWRRHNTQQAFVEGYVPMSLEPTGTSSSLSLSQTYALSCGYK